MNQKTKSHDVVAEVMRGYLRQTLLVVGVLTFAMVMSALESHDSSSQTIDLP
ncbi:MAG: hypothetical protein ACI8T1_004311 [Verrucomicrobiales bacterium]|jgi:hypothetical protein